MKINVAFIAACIATSSYAGSNSFIIAAPRNNVPVSVNLEIAAEYVAVPISISSSEKDALRNLENVQGVTAKIADAARKNQSIKLRQGMVSLAVGQGEESAFSSYKSNNQSSNASLVLVAPLTKERDVFQVAREMTAFIQAIPKNDQTRVSFGATSLGVEEPERFRERLLPLIQKDLERVRNAFGNPKSFEVSGLESPVAVIQQDDRNIAVFIPYKLKIGQ